MENVGCVYDNDFPRLTEFHRMETGDSMFRNVDLGISDPPNNFWSKA